MTCSAKTISMLYDEYSLQSVNDLGYTFINRSFDYRKMIQQFWSRQQCEFFMTSFATILFFFSLVQTGCGNVLRHLEQHCIDNASKSRLIQYRFRRSCSREIQVLWITQYWTRIQNEVFMYSVTLEHRFHTMYVFAYNLRSAYPI